MCWAYFQQATASPSSTPCCHCVLVLSPLVALMEDQLAHIQTLGVSAVQLGGKKVDLGEKYVCHSMVSVM